MGLSAASTLAAMLVLLPQLAYSWRVDLSRLREQTITITTKPSENLLGVPIVDPPTRVAGYFRLDRTKAAEMFYFFFQARKAPASAPLVLWMTGGPGCSSELAVLYENGPYTLDSAGQALVETEYGWDVTHNMIFVDQPIGTGFSYTTDEADTVYDESGVAEDMLDFLQHFFAAHPDLAGRPFYITGESYAGHYVPAVSHRVWLSNTKQEGPHINLKGLAVGNGLTDPAIQYNAYGDFALANNLIGKATRMWMSFLFPICRWANAWCDSTNWDLVCALGMQYCVATQFEPILAANPGINVYDITKKCDGQLCYDFTAADKFLNSPATRAALGVGDRHWVSCSYDVYENFMGDWLHRFDTVLPDMMADGIRVMIYAGDLDLICNFLGNRRWVDALEWAGAADWDGAADEDWVVQGKAAGKVKSVGPLTFVQVYKAGHMVPMDQGLNGLAMITAWTRNLSLTSANDHRAHDTLPRLFDRLTQPAKTAHETTSNVPKDTVMEGEQDQSTSSSVLQANRQQQQQQRGSRGLPPQHGPRMSHFVSKMTSVAAKAAAAARQAAGGVPMAARKLRRAF